MIKVKLHLTELERLQRRYDALVRDAELISKYNPARSNEKMNAAQELLVKIIELKIARNN